MYHGKEICLPFAGLVWLNLRITFFLKLFLQSQYIFSFAGEINNHHPSVCGKARRPCLLEWIRSGLLLAIELCLENGYAPKN